MAEEWPISVAEAARRLGINENQAGVMVRSHDIPTVTTYYNARGLTEETFGILREASLAFRRNTNRKAKAPA
jgi:hypothetical protein